MRSEIYRDVGMTNVMDKLSVMDQRNVLVKAQTRCHCMILHFALEIKPEQGPVWLSLTAAIDVKPFLVSEGFPPPGGFRS
jgi:hypothetical protein